jgi:hypothetical protein
MCSQQHFSYIVACCSWVIDISCPAGICIGMGAGLVAGWPAASAAAVITIIMIEFS